MAAIAGSAPASEDGQRGHLQGWAGETMWGFRSRERNSGLDHARAPWLLGWMGVGGRGREQWAVEEMKWRRAVVEIALAPDKAA